MPLFLGKMNIGHEAATRSAREHCTNALSGQISCQIVAFSLEPSPRPQAKVLDARILLTYSRDPDAPADPSLLPGSLLTDSKAARRLKSCWRCLSTYRGIVF